MLAPALLGVLYASADKAPMNSCCCCSTDIDALAIDPKHSAELDDDAICRRLRHALIALDLAICYPCLGTGIESIRFYLPHSNTIAVGALEGQSGLQRTKMAHQRAVMCSACEPRGSCFRL